jgi:SAM-dependent methyltransferase
VNAETLYEEYWQSGFHTTDQWTQAELQRYLAPLLGLDRVLDYGCGVGCAYQSRLVREVKGYVGADVADVALQTLRQRGLPAAKIDPATGRVDTPAEQFDGACCMEVFEHLFDPLQAAKEIHRLLKPGGVLVATVPNFGYHAWRLLALLRAQVPSEPHSNRYDGVHIRFFSKLMFKRLLKDAGFDDVRIGSYDKSNVWDVFQSMGKIAYITRFARRHLPSFMYLTFLQDVWPNVFAMRLRAVARKSSGSH